MTESQKDMQARIDELVYIASDQAKKLRAMKPPSADLQKRNDHIRASLHKLSKEPSLERIITQTHAIYMDLRSLQGVIGAYVASNDWQSPSISHSLWSMAGRQEGTIHAAINDYKRDQHEDARVYEQKFLKEYIDAPLKFPIHIYATHSGMAAFTTIVTFLHLEGKLTGNVVVGKATYFEAKDLLRKYLGKRLIEVDEENTNATIRAIQKSHPSCLFFDTIGNTANMPKPDLIKIIESINKQAKADTYIVIDNTCAATSYQPLKKLINPLSKVHLIIYESLNKFHQFGMDRVMGGIIWAMGKDTGKLFDYREHLGTIISDAAVLSLPTPNRKLFDSRLRRLFRNASLLASGIQTWIDDHPNSSLDHVVHPGTGAFLMLAFKPTHQSVSYYQLVIKRVLSNAKKQHIQMATGTSFGFPVPRIYLTATRTTSTKPFIRIAVGCGTISEIDKLIQVFQNAFR